MLHHDDDDDVAELLRATASDAGAVAQYLHALDGDEVGALARDRPSLSRALTVCVPLAAAQCAARTLRGARGQAEGGRARRLAGARAADAARRERAAAHGHAHHPGARCSQRQ